MPRARLFLVTPDIIGPDFAARLDAALAAGDVSSLLIRTSETDLAILQRTAEELVPVAQAWGVAALVAQDSRVVGRSGADGIHVEGGPEAVAEAAGRFQPRQIVGAGAIRTRDEAMAIGEAGADYLLFGLLDRPEDPGAHPKSLDLGRWWAELFQPPCVVLAGSDVASVREAAGTGAEFVGLRAAVWDHPEGPAAAIAAANAILDELAAEEPA